MGAHGFAMGIPLEEPRIISKNIRLLYESLLHVIKEELGHEDLKTTQIYSHSQKENL